jgi:ATP-dependent DNA helicase RecQ
MDNEIKCPICGAKMILRVAKKGPHKGKTFWSCSRYKYGCKGIINIQEEEEKYVIDNFKRVDKIATRASPSNRLNLPIYLQAREKLKNHQVLFIQLSALPEIILESINDFEISNNIRRMFSQWRLDFSDNDADIVVSDINKIFISLIEKILTRGKITLISEHSEKELKKILKINEPAELEDLDKDDIINVFTADSDFVKTLNNDFLYFDSREEEIFYSQIIPKVIGKNYRQFVLPQVNIISLLEDSNNLGVNNFQRVDFAIFHPLLEKNIIIEIDGGQHEGNTETDKQRNHVLNNNGYEIIRIKSKDIGDLVKDPYLNKSLKEINDFFSSKKVNKYYELKDHLKKIYKLVLASKITHQIQITLLQALKFGFLDLDRIDQWKIYSDINIINIFSEKESYEILNNAVEDFIELFINIGNLYKVNVSSHSPEINLISGDNYKIGRNIINIFFSDNPGKGNSFCIQNIYFPKDITSNYMVAPLLRNEITNFTEENLLYFLNYIFRKKSFWEGQFEAITRALRLKDTIVLLPTGAGKSLIFQLAAFLMPGSVIVVDPINSLMEDQIYNLAGFGIERCIAINSLIKNEEDRDKILNFFSRGEYIFCYIAPERFQIEKFRDSLSSLTQHTPVLMVVVDEAHCVSEWGHDFRTAYLNLSEVARKYCSSGSYTPFIFALTGTASPSVLRDVKRELKIEEYGSTIVPGNFDRKELNFEIIKSRSREKFKKLEAILNNILPSKFNKTFTNIFNENRKNTFSGLVFCPHIGGDFGVERISSDISYNLRINNGTYSGRMDSDEKINIARAYKRNKVPLLVCTKAFGMGIDKPNIRYTVHYCMPPSLESFYQEAGRAGRDRNNSFCFIITSNDDEKRTSNLLDPNTSIEVIIAALKNIRYSDNDDITRDLYFHTQSFRGIKAELKNIKAVLKRIGNINLKNTLILAIDENLEEEVNYENVGKNEHNDSRKIVEKSIHRLLVLGVISDYTVDFNNNQFKLDITGIDKEEIVNHYGNYVVNFLGVRRKEEEIKKANAFIDLSLDNFIIEISRLLLTFIYKNIEEGRRRALKTMFDCANETDPKIFRERLLDYLGRTDDFSDRIIEIIESLIGDKDAGIFLVRDLISQIDSFRDANEIRGAVSRSLESYPDQPALLMLRAVSEVFTANPNYEIISQNLIASLKSAFSSYGITNEHSSDFASWAINQIYRINKEYAKELTKEFIIYIPIRENIRWLLKTIDKNLSYIPAIYLTNKIIDRIDNLSF